MLRKRLQDYRSSSMEYLHRTLFRYLPDSLMVPLTYRHIFHRQPDLKSPRLFTEKIAWRKLHQRDNRFSIFADKIAVKAKIAELVGRTRVIETLWTGARPEDIPFDQLIPPYVIKTNFGSGDTVFIRESADISRDKIVNDFNRRLRHAHGRRYREWAYQGIPRKILVERMVAMPSGDVPEDYKFFVYHGKVHFIQVDTSRFKGHFRAYFDFEWNSLPVKVVYREVPTPVAKPGALPEMIEVAEKIGALFDFVRIDLYSTPSGVLFGEATFYPGAGLEPFEPQEWDLKFGEPWTLWRIEK